MKSHRVPKGPASAGARLENRWHKYSFTRVVSEALRWLIHLRSSRITEATIQKLAIPATDSALAFPASTGAQCSHPAPQSAPSSTKPPSCCQQKSMTSSSSLAPHRLPAEISATTNVLQHRNARELTSVLAHEGVDDLFLLCSRPASALLHLRCEEVYKAN